VDDIDHLSNRRVRTVGEQLYAQFGVGLARMARTIRERMNVRDNEVFTPIDLDQCEDSFFSYQFVLRNKPVVSVHGSNQSTF
jgi:DNA-directed RNA polymerase beta subunit